MITIIVLLAHLIYVSLLDFFPSPEFFIFPYLASAGWQPYTQIVDHHFPLLWLLPINLSTLGISTVLNLKLLMLFVISLQSLLIYKISKSKLSVVFYAIWQPIFLGSRLWIDMFIPIFTLPAYLLFKRNHPVWAALFLGLSLCLKQSILPLVVYVLLINLLKLPLRKIIITILATILPPLILVLYMYIRGVLPDFIYWTFTFNLTTYPAMASLAPSAAQLAVVLVVLSLLVASGKKDLIWWSLLSVVGGTTRFGFEHIQPAIPFFAIALAQSSKITKIIFLGISLAIFVIFANKASFFHTQFFDSHTISLISRISQLTQPGSSIFLLATQPHIYVLTNTYPPDKFFVYHLPWTLQPSLGRQMQALENDPPAIVVYDTSNQIDGQNLTDYAPLLLKYIQTNYFIQESIGPYLIYARRF